MSEVRPKLRPIAQDWALNALLIAEYRAGCPVLGPTLLASSLRRATIFAIAALGAHPIFDENRREFCSSDTGFGRYLLRARCRDLLAACGLNAPGLLSFLERTDGEPLESPDDYRTLVTVLATPNKKALAGALGHVRPLTSFALRAAVSIDPVFATPELLSSFQSLDDVRAANEIVDFVKSRCSGPLTSDTVKQGAPRTRRQWARWAQHVLLRKGDSFPPTPKLDTSFFKLVEGSSMVEAARVFRNCLRSKVLEVAAGSAAFFVADTEPASVVELRRIEMEKCGSHFWVLHAVHVAKNRPVPEHVVLEVERRLVVHGIGRLRHAAAPDMSRALALRLGLLDTFLYG